MAKETGAGGGGAVCDQGEEAAGGTEVGALRLTKPAEGAALWLPVLRAPPRESRFPAAPSGSPAPPPLWEATWTCRFGPSAKSRLQGCGSPPPRPGSPAPLLPHDRKLSVRGTPLEHVAKPRGGGAGKQLGGPGRGAPTLQSFWAGEQRRLGLRGGRAPGKVPARRRALREHEPGGGASESESDKPPPLRKVLRGRRGPRGLSCHWLPWHSPWKVFEATKASQPRLPREVTDPAAQLTSSSRRPEEGKDPPGWSLN